MPEMTSEPEADDETVWAHWEKHKRCDCARETCCEGTLASWRKLYFSEEFEPIGQTP